MQSSQCHNTLSKTSDKDIFYLLFSRCVTFYTTFILLTIGKLISCRTIVSVMITIGILISSCSKLVEVEPPITSTNGEIVFRDDATAIAVLTGIYTNMSGANVTDANYLTNIFFTTGLASDEFELWDKSNTNYLLYYSNNISPEVNTWSNIYKMIFVTNSAVEELNKASTITPLIKNQLIGEAKFMRAFCYFYLVNLYGAVPLPLSTDFQINRILPRESISNIYQQIIADLTDATNLLNENYVGKDAITQTSERVRPNKWAAISLLARVYLFTGKYDDAETQAGKIIGKTDLYNLVDLNSTFLMNNKEAIWQLQPVGKDNNANTKEGQLLKLFPASGPNPFNPVYLTSSSVNVFDQNDQRKVNWIDSVNFSGTTYYFSNKYKVGNEVSPTVEYSTVLRLAEQYLIRAESRILQGKITEGISDLNILRKRATDILSLPDQQLAQLPLTLSKSEAIAALEKERRTELFSEWGHRWFDLKRMVKADLVLGIVKGSNWQSTDQLFPIPESEIFQNASLEGHQNPGY